MDMQQITDNTTTVTGRKPRGIAVGNEDRLRLVALADDMTQPALVRLKARAMLRVEAKAKFRQAARELEISTSTLYRWARDYRCRGLEKLLGLRPMNRAFYTPSLM